MSEEVEFYTVAEAARELRVSQATVWRWIAARRLRAYRVGPRRIRIRKQDLGSVVRPVGARETAVEDREREAGDIFVGYEPSRVKEALRRSAGALREIDRERLLEDLRAEREQDSIGRLR
jgi:excisionase family DNA binding protein